MSVFKEGFQSWQEDTTLKQVTFMEISFCELQNVAFSENLFSRIAFFKIFHGN